MFGKNKFITQLVEAIFETNKVNVHNIKRVENVLNYLVKEQGFVIDWEKCEIKRTDKIV